MGQIDRMCDESINVLEGGRWKSAYIYCMLVVFHAIKQQMSVHLWPQQHQIQKNDHKFKLYIFISQTIAVLLRAVIN